MAKKEYNKKINVDDFIINFDDSDELLQNENDLGIYSTDSRQSMLDNDELSPFEDAFMNGYQNDFEKNFV